MASRLLSELRFGAYLIYSPRGSSEVSRQSRHVRDAVKRGDKIRAIVERLAEVFADSGLAAVLGADVTLVPAPRSAPLVAGGLWPGRRVCDELVAAGLGKQVLPCLVRTEAVPKSAFQPFGERPDARKHFETMRAEATLLDTARLTIVDDIITKGNTLLGGASRVVKVYPKAELAAFALVRTLGFQPEVERIAEPCVGVIRESHGDARREP